MQGGGCAVISDERLRTAAQIAGKALADSLLEPEDCQHTFSPAFERKMNRLIARTKHQGAYTALKRVACFFLVLLLSGTVWLGVDAQAREIVFGWVSQKVEDARHYFFEGASPDGIAESDYRLAEVPAGYAEVGSFEEENGWSVVYADEEGRYMDFGYRWEAKEGLETALFFTVDDIEKKSLFIRDMPAEYYQDDTGEAANLMVWFDAETETLLYISAYLDEETLVELAENVIREEK